MNYDVGNVFSYLLQTPEGGLRKMLIDNKPFTEVHFNLLMKVVRSSTPENFAIYWEKQEFPKVKMSPSETKLKESFWGDCFTTFQSRGLVDNKKAA